MQQLASGPVLRIHDIFVRILYLDPAIFVIDLQDANNSQFFSPKFFCLFLFEGTFTSFFKDKKFLKKSLNSRNQGFSYFFCLVIEGSRSGSGSGSIPLTDGSGSGSRRSKNMRIRWIRIRIGNTDRDTTIGLRAQESIQISSKGGD